MVIEIFETQMFCKSCGSATLTVNKEGFTVCCVCGEQQDFCNFGLGTGTNDLNEYSLSKSHNIYQEEVRTTVGTYMERNKEKYKRLESVQNYATRSYIKTVYNDAYTEISRICSELKLSKNFIKKSSRIFKEIWSKLSPRKMERGIQVLAPVVIYRTSKILGISIDLNRLCALMACSKKKFKKVLTSTYNMFSIYKQEDLYEDKCRIVIGKICYISEQMKMPNQVKERAIDILLNNLTTLMETTSAVAAAAAVGSSVLSLELRSEYRLYKIGEIIDASPASINSRIYQLLESKKFPYQFKITILDEYVPKFYDKLIE